MQQANLVWPTKEPGEDLDYQIDATSKIADSADAIISASVTVAPSGTGEMVATQIVVTGSFITVWLSGGIAARVYQVNVQIPTSFTPGTYNVVLSSNLSRSNAVQIAVE